MTATRQRVLRITIKDCDVQTFRVGGAGGQHKDKTSSGVRVVHRASKAMGQASSSRSQLTNKRSAFRRMAESPRFQVWCRTYENDKQALEDDVNVQLKAENIKVEVRVNGRWTEIPVNR